MPYFLWEKGGQFTKLLQKGVVTLLLANTP